MRTPAKEAVWSLDGERRCWAWQVSNMRLPDHTEGHARGNPALRDLLRHFPEILIF
jgi:hypothetical protein